AVDKLFAASTATCSPRRADHRPTRGAYGEPAPTPACRVSEVWTCVDRLSIHHDINPLQLTAFSQLGSGGGSDELRCEGDEIRANAGLPDRGRRPAHRGITDRKNRAIQAGVSGERRVYPRFAGSRAPHLIPSEGGIRRSPPSRIEQAQAIERLATWDLPAHRSRRRRGGTAGVDSRHCPRQEVGQRPPDTSPRNSGLGSNWPVALLVLIESSLQRRAEGTRATPTLTPDI